jgi:Tol biopolymer transport system component
MIFTIAPHGTRERQLTKLAAAFSDDYPGFAVDGSLIAFQQCDAVPPHACRIFTMRPDGSGLRRVGGCRPGESPPRCANISYPANAANDRRIAFVRAFGRFHDDGYDHQGIYTMSTDGSSVRRVTLPHAGSARDDEPQWSPDSRSIVFVRGNVTAKPAGGQAAIFVVHADGSGLRGITPWNLRAGDGPNWSPDGTRILFRSDDFTNSDLFTVGPDGSGLKQITHLEPTTRLYSSGFSPDGTSITFGMQGTDDEADVFTMRLDGTELTPVTRTPLGDSAPDWAASDG